MCLLAAVVACRNPKPGSEPPQGRSDPQPGDRSQLVAIADGIGLTIARIERGGVTPVASVPKTFEFAWLDPRTLINADLWGSDGNTVTVTRLVDGKAVEAVPVPHAELGEYAAISLGLTRSGEVWLGTCATAYRTYGPALADPWTSSDDGPCEGRHYLRVLPNPRRQQDTMPAGIVREYRPPTVAAPPQVKLSTETIAMQYRCDTGWCPYEITVSVCEGNGVRTRYPEPPPDHRTNDGGKYLHAGKMRWVSERPLVYEVDFEWCPDRDERTCAKYLRPCEPTPLDGYAWLGGARWASFASGTWTFWDGETKLGTLRGDDVLRAYPQ